MSYYQSLFNQYVGNFNTLRFSDGAVPGYFLTCYDDQGTFKWVPLGAFAVTDILAVANQTTVSDDSKGVYTIGTVQDINTTSDVEFKNLVLSEDLSVRDIDSRNIVGQALKLTTGAGTDRILVSDASGNLTYTSNYLKTLTGTSNQITVSGSYPNLTLSLPQDIATTSNPTFSSLTTGIVYSPVFQLQDPTPSGRWKTYFGNFRYNFEKADGSGNFSGTPTIYFDGTLGVVSPGFRMTTSPALNYAMISDADGDASWQAIVNSITGTSNQVIASANTGSITLSLPQSIGTSNSPQFASLRLTTGATNNYILKSSASGDTSWVDINTLVPIYTLTGVANQTVVSNIGSAYTIGTVQNINTTSSPTFANLYVSALDPFIQMNNTLGTSSLLKFVLSGGVNYIQSGSSTTGGSIADLSFTSMLAGYEWMRLKSDGTIRTVSILPNFNNLYNIGASGNIYSNGYFNNLLASTYVYSPEFRMDTGGTSRLFKSGSNNYLDYDDTLYVRRNSGSIIPVNFNSDGTTTFNYDVNVAVPRVVNSYFYKLNDALTNARWLIAHGNFNVNFTRYNSDGSLPTNPHFIIGAGQTYQTTGSASVPNYSFSFATTSGLFYDGTYTGLATNGQKCITMDTNQRVSIGAVTNPDSTHQLYVNGTGIRMNASSGITNTSRHLAFSIDGSNIGYIYGKNGGKFGIEVGGTERVEISSAETTFSHGIVANNAAVFNAGVDFNNNVNIIGGDLDMSANSILDAGGITCSQLTTTYGIISSGGYIQLPNPDGGTSSQLNTYEEYNGTADFKDDFKAGVNNWDTGGTISMNIRITRVGRIVNLYWSANQNTFPIKQACYLQSNNGAIPSRFLPYNTPTLYIQCYVNNIGTFTKGMISIDLNGRLRISNSDTSDITNFSYTGGGASQTIGPYPLANASWSH